MVPLWDNSGGTNGRKDRRVELRHGAALHQPEQSRKKLQYLDERIIWGVWVPRGLRLAYKGMAAHLRVSMCVLVGYILSQWLAQSSEALLLNEEEGVKYGEYLARKYLAPPELVER